jgi:hypothetical protein
MYKIPFDVSKNKDQKKFISKSEDRVLVDNKIINRKTEPTSYNVHSAATAMELKVGATPLSQIRKETTVTSQANLSLKVLNAMNVGLDPLMKDFSLLEDITREAPDANPNIMDKELVGNIQNSPAPINNYFPNDRDPILQLDDGNNSPVEYSDLQRDGKFTAPVDLSKILSDLNILNQSDIYFGKLKYYK